MVAYSIINYNETKYILLFDVDTKQKLYFDEVSESDDGSAVNFYEDYYYLNGKVFRKISNGDDSFDYVPVAFFSNDILSINIIETTEINSELQA